MGLDPTLIVIPATAAIGYLAWKFGNTADSIDQTATNAGGLVEQLDGNISGGTIATALGVVEELAPSIAAAYEEATVLVSEGVTNVQDRQVIASRLRKVERRIKDWTNRLERSNKQLARLNKRLTNVKSRKTRRAKAEAKKKAQIQKLKTQIRGVKAEITLALNVLDQLQAVQQQLLEAMGDV